MSIASPLSLSENCVYTNLFTPSKIDNFVATMQFYCRRDVDKSLAEDKHLFRPEELMASGRSLGLELSHYPNRRITHAPNTTIEARIGYFGRFFCDYLRYCMGWDTVLSDKVAKAMSKYFSFFEPLERTETSTPSCFGIFVFTKL